MPINTRPVVPLRSSPAAWAAPLVAALIIFFWFSVLDSGRFDPYWTGYIARAGAGLQYGLPIVAGAAAWASRRRLVLADPARMRGSQRSSVRVLLAHVWPLPISVMVGYSAVLVAQIVELPPRGAPDFAPLVSFVAMVVVATSLGWVLGALLPAAIAVPLAVLALAQWALYPLSDGSNLSWRNITGYATFLCCDLVPQGPDPRAILAPIPVALALAAVASMTIRLRWRQLAVPAGAAIVVALVAANYLSIGTGATASSIRSFVSQTCTGDQPIVCAYPETSPRARALISKTLSSAYSLAGASGIALPTTVSAPSSVHAPANDRLEVYFPSESDATQILVSFAGALYENSTCAPIDVSNVSQLPADIVVPYALAVVLGADPEDALPSVAYGSESSSSSDAVAPGDVLAALGLPTSRARLELVTNWRRAQSKCEE